MFIYGNVDDLQNIKEQVAIDEKIICLLDDFLGSNVEYLEKNIADSTLDKIVGIFKNSKNNVAAILLHPSANFINQQV